jgi:hypothetical protein
MVDRRTKYTHSIPCLKSLTAEKMAHLVLDRLIRYHGISKSFKEAITSALALRLLDYIEGHGEIIVASNASGTA